VPGARLRGILHKLATANLFCTLVMLSVGVAARFAFTNVNMAHKRTPICCPNEPNDGIQNICDCARLRGILHKLATANVFCEIFTLYASFGSTFCFHERQYVRRYANM
jgi:hypothetical protein